MNRLLPVSFAFAAALATTLPAAAADNSFYVLGSAGLTDTGGRKAQADATIVNAGMTSFTSSADEKDHGYKAQFGYRFNRNFAVEGGYMDLGRYTYHADGTAPITATRDGKGPMDALNVVVVGSLPLTEQFSLIGKLGVAAQRMRFHCEGTGIACSNPDRTSHGTSLQYGAGVEWAFTPNWFVRGEYEVVQKIGDSFNANGTTGTSRADLKMGSVGVGYRF